jgi:hypothetical protein
MRFASRTDWDSSENDLSRAWGAAPEPKIDLTLSNPTRCGFDYGELGVPEALAEGRVLNYAPEPLGMASTREAVAELYGVGPENIVLTASSSESYAHLFRLLCNSGDEVLVPTPSYPLFDFLADLADVRLVHYPLIYRGGLWRIDRGALENLISDKTRAVVVVNPNNPTSSYLRGDDAAFLRGLAAGRGLAIISDEVFSDYAISPAPDACRSLAGATAGPLTVVLGGLSKSLGLPQMKLGWMVLSGDPEAVGQARARLEIICDTFLSVSTPAQILGEKLLPMREKIAAQIRERVRKNYELLRANLPGGLRALPIEGGWYGVIEADGVPDEGEFAVALARERSVLIHPGFYYGFDTGSHFVLSLLPEATAFAGGIKRLGEFYQYKV